MRIAEWAVASAPDRIVTIGLGSCVAIVLYDGRTKIGGMAHVLLPTGSAERATDEPAKFPATAVPLLLREMRARGATGPITARLVGGASLFAGLLTREGAGAIGERNIEASRAALRTAQVRLVGEAVGGDCGRSVTLDTQTGRLHVRSRKEGDRDL